jgi:hypothetical protein
MIYFRRFILLAGAMLLAAGLYPSSSQAGQGGFFFAPFFAPWPGPFYEPPWRERYYAPPRKTYSGPARRRTTVRSVQPKVAQTRRTRRAALVVPRKTAPVQQSINCEKAQAIVADYGFKDIKVEACDGATHDFRASRDGEAFSIQILAADGEFAKVQRLR